MNREKKIDTRKIGLNIGSILNRYFLKSEDLHYGYWTDDLSLELFNLARAQERHSDFLMTNIPETAKTILDVGCGSGKLAERLLNKGYRVDCVSPSLFFTEQAKKLLGDRAHIFECRYERLETEDRYDLILFSESFQYVKLEKAIQNSFRFLNEGGHLLICDFFATEAKGKSSIGGGHKLVRFYHQIGRYPFKLVKDIDITRYTAPNIDLVNGLLMNVGLPIWNLASSFLKNNHPFIARFIRWKYKKKIAKIRQKYLTGTWNAAHFTTYKTYRLLLYQKTGVNLRQDNV
ncbi:MAG: class I SAM-dependent methyltransferase [Candidatus Omnitrophota bacterium]